MLSAAAMALVLSACTTGGIKTEPSVTSVEAAPTKTFGPEFDAAKQNLEKTARAAAHTILTDIASPKSLARNVANNQIRNAEALNAPDFAQKVFPQLTVYYDGITHEIDVISLYNPKPEAPAEQQALGGSVQLFFNAGNERNILDSKLSSGGQMSPSDVSALIDSPSTGLKSVELWDAKSDTYTSAFYDGSGQVTTQLSRGQDRNSGVTVTQPSYYKDLNALADSVVTTLATLEQPLG